MSYKNLAWFTVGNTPGTGAITARAQRGAGGSSGTIPAQQRAHRLTMIRQQNDLILAIAIAVAGSGAID